MYTVAVVVLLNAVCWISCQNGERQLDVTQLQVGTNRDVGKICEARVYEMPSDGNPDCYRLQENLAKAVREGNIAEIKEVLKNGANVEGTYDDNYPALYVSAMLGRTEVVEFLLNNGADVNRVLTFGKTPLKAAIYSNHLETVKVLLKRGADVCNNTSDEGTALQIAQKKGLQDIIKALEVAGAEKCW